MKILELSNGYQATVDDRDYEIVSKFKWTAQVSSRTVYAYRRQRYSNSISEKIYLHRFILGLLNDKSLEVDHVNGSGLDNRRINLRPCIGYENKRNVRIRLNSKSGYKGVGWNKLNKTWDSYIKFHGRKIHIGCFKDKKEAAKAYDKKSNELFGEFSRPNFVSKN